MKVIITRLMKLIAITGVGLLLMLLPLGCEKEKSAAEPSGEAESTEEPAIRPGENRPGFAHDNIVLLESAADAPAELKNGLDNLFLSYLSLVDALSAGDLQKADSVAEEMLSSSSSLTPDGLQGDAAEAWANHKEVITTALEKFLSSDSPDEKRLHFDHISKVMYCTLASFARPAEPAYLQYCPEALGGGGAYFLTDTRKVSGNPYLPHLGNDCAVFQHEI